MKKKFACLFLVLAVVLCGSMVMAQEKDEKKMEEKKEEKKENDKKGDDKVLEAIKDIYRRLDIGVKLYLDWYGAWGWDNAAFDRVTKYSNPRWSNVTGTGTSDVSAKNNNSFRVQRAYLDVKYKITDILSVRLTSDVDATVTPAGASNAAFHLFLKYAYLEAKKDFGPISLSASGGMIETPVISHSDKLSDLRWISTNYINNSKQVLNGRVIDDSSDLGVRASIGIMKWLTLTGAFTNGEGFKSLETNASKAIYGLATINPFFEDSKLKELKNIYISGFARYEITAKYDFTGKKAKREYFGYGVAYSSDLIKVGMFHIFPYVRTVGVATDFTTYGGLPTSLFSGQQAQIFFYPEQWRGYQIVDAFLHFNLGAVVRSVPLIVTGRYAYGLQRGTYQKFLADPELGKKRETSLYAAGIGWKFNNNFRILIGGEIQRFLVTKNPYLRYNEQSPTTGVGTGTDYYKSNLTSLGGPNTPYVGSTNPHNAKRLYVKVEVTF